MSAFTDAVARLASFFNGNAYNASSNPGGLAGGGHRVVFVPLVRDVATVGAAVADLASAAASSATAAAASASAAAASATMLSGTSGTSKTIATGAVGPFATQSGKAWSPGVWVNIRSAANPLDNFMVGQVLAYSGGALSVNVLSTGGSGAYADWIIDLSAPPGQAGGTGAIGPRGVTPAFLLSFSNSTSDVDPGNGTFRFSSSVLSAASFVYIDNLNAATQDIVAWLDALDDSSTAGDRGRLRFYDPTGNGAFVDFKITSNVIDGTGYRKVPGTVVAASVVTSAAPPFLNGAAVAVHFTATGNRGVDGTGAGDVVGPSSATDGTIALFDTSSGKLLKTSGVGVGTSGANVGRLDTSNTYSAPQSVAAKLDMQQDFAISGDITPTQVNADQNDYNPSGLAAASVLRLSSDTKRTITGLAGGADGRLMVLRNVGSFDITLANESAASSAGNRFSLIGDRILRPRGTLVLQYDNTLTRWLATAVVDAPHTVPVLAGHCISLTSGSPPVETDVVGANTVYVVPSLHDLVGVFDGVNFVPRSYSEIAVALNSTNHTSGNNYDLWLAYSGGNVVAGTGPAWASATSRGTGAGTTEIETYKGRRVNKNAITIRFDASTTYTIPARQATLAGTIRTSGAGTTEDSLVKRFVSQSDNVVLRALRVIDATSSWNYSSGTVRQANGNTANKIEWVQCVSGRNADVKLSGESVSTATSTLAGVAIGIDSITSEAAGATHQVAHFQVANEARGTSAMYNGYPGLGYHYAAWLEFGWSSGTQTHYGSNTFGISGLNATMVL